MKIYMQIHLRIYIKIHMITQSYIHEHLDGLDNFYFSGRLYFFGHFFIVFIFWVIFILIVVFIFRAVFLFQDVLIINQARKPECGITQPSSNVVLFKLTPLGSSMISLVTPIQDQLDQSTKHEGVYRVARHLKDSQKGRWWGNQL